MSDLADSAHPSVVLAWLWVIYGGIAFVLGHIAYGVLFILDLLYRPLAFILQPVVLLLNFVLACLALPFHLIVRLETIYIYLGVAAIVGVAGGLLIRAVSSGLLSILRLNSASEPKGRTVKQYRQQKRRQNAGSDDARHPSPYMSAGSVSPESLSLSEGSKKRRRHRSLLAQTIMEEEDSDL